MAVSSETNSIRYAGNGSSSTPYSIPFPLAAAEHLVVSVIDADENSTALELGTDYTVAENLTSLTTSAAVDEESFLDIVRATPALQPTVLEEGQRIGMKSLERTLDQMTMAIQDVALLPGPAGPPGEAGLPVLTGTADPNVAGVEAAGVGQQYQLIGSDPVRIFFSTALVPTVWTEQIAGTLTLTRGEWRAQVEAGTIPQDYIKVRDGAIIDEDDLPTIDEDDLAIINPE